MQIEDMANDIKVTALRGGKEILNSLSLIVGNKVLDITLKEEIVGQYNIRFIFERIETNLSYPDSILGKLVESVSLGNFDISNNSPIKLISKDKLINDDINLSFKGNYNIDIKMFKDTPLNYYPALDAIPVPTNLITIYIKFSSISDVFIASSIENIQKNFDAYSHLGFFLVDLVKMKEVIEREYGNQELDLVYEFSNSDIIDKLFDEEIIMIVWGINPYTYPIYSTDKIEYIKPLLGKEHDQAGVFKIREDISELSLIPGHELKNYPHFLSKEWVKIQLKGEGKRTYLKPYVLQDSDLNTVLVSFLLYREGKMLEESKPLINVDLLYSL